MGQTFDTRELDLNKTVNATATKSYFVGTNTRLSVRMVVKPGAGTFSAAVVKMQTSVDQLTWTTDTAFAGVTGATLRRNVDVSGTWFVRFIVTTLEAADGVALIDTWVYGPPEMVEDVLGGSAAVPIGGCIPWLKSLSGVPGLPARFVECDGSTISDLDSPLNGVTIPDLNGDNRFLRGNASSGATGGAATVTLSQGNLPANVVLSDSGGASAPGGIGSWGGSGGGTSHENLPPWYNVVWIIRIK